MTEDRFYQYKKKYNRSNYFNKYKYAKSGEYNEYLSTPRKTRSSSRHRHQFNDQDNYRHHPYKNKKFNKHNENFRKRNQRSPSPLKGSEEYNERKIQRTSDMIMKKLMGYEDDTSESVDKPENKSTTVNNHQKKNKKTPKKNNLKNKQNEKSSNPFKIQDIHEKIIRHIMNLNHDQKVKLINASNSEYDDAIDRFYKQNSLRLSKALRDMCKQDKPEINEIVNSIIPDFEIKLEELPKTFLEELSCTFDVGFQVFMNNVPADDLVRDQDDNDSSTEQVNLNKTGSSMDSNKNDELIEKVMQWQNQNEKSLVVSKENESNLKEYETCSSDGFLRISQNLFDKTTENSKPNALQNVNAELSNESHNFSDSDDEKVPELRIPLDETRSLDVSKNMDVTREIVSDIKTEECSLIKSSQKISHQDINESVLETTENMEFKFELTDQTLSHILSDEIKTEMELQDNQNHICSEEKLPVIESFSANNVTTNILENEPLNTFKTVYNLSVQTDIAGIDNYLTHIKLPNVNKTTWAESIDLMFQIDQKIQELTTLRQEILVKVGLGFDNNIAEIPQNNKKSPLKLDENFECILTERILTMMVFEDALITGSDRGQITYFDLPSGKISLSFNVGNSIVTNLFAMGSHLFIGSQRRTLDVYKFKSDKLEEQIHLDDGVQCIEQAWSYLFLGGGNGYLMRINLETKKVVFSEKISDASIMVIKSTKEGARNVLITGGRNSSISVRDALTGLQMRTMNYLELPRVYSLFRNDSLVYVATSNFDILVFDFYSGKHIKKLDFTKSKAASNMQLVRDILFVSCHDGKIYVYDICEDKLIDTLDCGNEVILSICVLYDKVIFSTINNKFKSMDIPEHVVKRISC